jgi:hypothetical protein
MATHMRIVTDIAITKDRKFGALLKLTDEPLKAWQKFVDTLDGTVEIDAVTIAKRKPVAEAPAAMPPPAADLATLAEIGAGVADAAKTAPAAEPESPAHPLAGHRGRAAA